MNARPWSIVGVASAVTIGLVLATAMPATASQTSSNTPGTLSKATQSAIEQTVRVAVDLRNNQSIISNAKSSTVTDQASAVFASEAVAAESNELNQLRQQRDLYAQFGEAFTSFTTTLSFGVITQNAGVATVPFTEVTLAKRTPDANGIARPDYGYDFDQTATLVETEGSWRLASLTHQVTDDLPETVLPGAAVLQARANGTLQKIATDHLQKAAAAKTTMQPMWTGIANRSKVVQALFAAGWPEVQTGNYNDPSQWFYDVYNQSYAWEGAQFLADFGGRYTTRFHADVAGPVWTAGDIAFWIWNQNTTVRYDHTTIVTFVDSSGSPYFTEHTNDHYNKSYAAMILGEPAPYVADMHD